jgi:nicotinamide-nucleotide amidase
MVQRCAMDDLVAVAEQIGQLLRDRNQTVAVAESSAGGLISAALLAVPGASAYYLGGAVVYTRSARSALLQIPDSSMEGMRASTEPYALLLARMTRERMNSTWAVSETGATGPAGNRYGDAAGHACFAVSGPRDMSHTLETGSADRQQNMRAFARAALNLLLEGISATTG